MGGSGVALHERPAAAGRHVCLAYDDDAQFTERARLFALDGLAAGEQVWFVGREAEAELRETVERFDGFGPALATGVARVVSLGGAYPAGAVVDPESQVAVFADAMRRAIADGFTGLRVVAETTDLVRTEDQVEAFARYEHLADRFMAAHPLSGMCAYRRGDVGDATLAELACMHAETNVATPSFRLHGCAPEAGAAAVSGEIDTTSRGLFTRALDRAAPAPVGGEVVLDGTGLEFIDHRGLLDLADYAQRYGATAVIRTSLPTAARIASLLDLPGVRVEAPGVNTEAMRDEVGTLSVDSPAVGVASPSVSVGAGR